MIVKAQSPVITCQCIRVPVLNGHTAAVFVKFRKKPTKEQLIERLRILRDFPRSLSFPARRSSLSSIWRRITVPRYLWTWTSRTVMGVSVGRLREDTVYDYKFVGLSHNTVRGAAGGAVLCAELLTARDI